MQVVISKIDKTTDPGVIVTKDNTSRTFASCLHNNVLTISHFAEINNKTQSLLLNTVEAQRRRTYRKQHPTLLFFGIQCPAEMHILAHVIRLSKVYFAVTLIIKTFKYEHPENGYVRDREILKK